MSRAASLLAMAVALAAPRGASAHEVLHEVQRNRAVALRAYFADGEALAYAQFEVYSPADASIPHQKGRTDRDGWVAFVPTTPGGWRVKVADATGHGLDVVVDCTASTARRNDAGPVATAAFVLRPLVGAGTIALVFGILLAVYRRRGAAR
jgi:nickel transport protein